MTLAGLKKCAPHVLRTLRHRRKLIDVEPRGIGEDERTRLHHLVELGEDRLLDVHLLERGLDHDVALADVVIARDRLDAR
jgi:hypothetical protein